MLLAVPSRSETPPVVTSPPPALQPCFLALLTTVGLPSLAFSSLYCCLHPHGHSPVFYHPFSTEEGGKCSPPGLWFSGALMVDHPEGKLELWTVQTSRGKQTPSWLAVLAAALCLLSLVQEAGGEQVIPTAFSGISLLTLATTLCLSNISVQPELCTCNSIPLLSFDSRRTDAEWQYRLGF